MSEPVVDPYVAWPTNYGVQQTGVISTTFDCFGLFGDNSTPWSIQVPTWPRVAFESPPNSAKEYLWMASLWIGGILGADTLVSHGFDEWFYASHEFHSINHPVGSVTRFEYPSSYSMRAAFTDTITAGVTSDYSGRPHIPLNVSIINRSHIWRTPEYEDIIIYDLILTNIGSLPIQSAYVGFFADADVGLSDVAENSHLDDVAGSIREHGIAYVIDNDGDPEGSIYDELTSARKIFAVRLLAASESLADTNFNWWLSPNTMYEDFGPRQRGTSEDPFFDFGTGGLGVPYGDINKYYVLSHKEWDYDQVYTASISSSDPVWLQPDEEIAEDVTFGVDIRFSLSWGPIDLLPDSSIRLLLTTFTADKVHNFTLNLFNLPDYPHGYLANLNFADVLANSARAEERAQYLLDPMMPVVGLHVVHNDADSAVVAWDPWIFDDVEGYEVYLSEVPGELLPYPGVVPPWLRPQSLECVASLQHTTRYKLPELDPNKFYFINLAHRSQAGIGSEGATHIIDRRGNRPAPQPDLEYVYFHDQEFVNIGFSDTTGWEIDHYRVYKLSDSEELDNIYQPFYSVLIPPSLTPRDSFEIDGTTYYYFAMEPWAVLEAGTTGFEDDEPVDGAYYVITAVDIYGFETDFSTPIQSSDVYAPTRDILVISGLPVVTLTTYDTVFDFYSAILDGYDWDVYHVSDTLNQYGCDHELEDCIDWRDFTRFKMVILDLESYDQFITIRSEERFNRIKKYILSGGKVAYFGCFYSMNYFYSSEARDYKQETTLVEPLFGADSLFFHFFQYYYWSGRPIDYDSCFGFERAEPARPELPEIAFDTLRHPFVNRVYTYWQDKTPPSVATFVPTQNAEILYRYRSRYPELSWLEGRPVGLRVLSESIETYLFGFHLWYMQIWQARQLVETIFDGVSTGNAETPQASLPEYFALRQNYPNPFNPETQICYDLPRRALVTLEIYNILGQRVKTLVNGAPQSAGSHYVQWYGDNDDREKVAAGIYFCRLRADDKTATRKMMLLK